MKISESLSHVSIKDYKGCAIAFFTRYTKGNKIYWFGSFASLKLILSEIAIGEKSYLLIKDDGDLEKQFRELLH